MQSTSIFPAKGTEKVNKAIEKIMRLTGTVALLWILLFLLVAGLKK